jgi:putative tricarboxylic transport membrane protein
MLTAAAHALTIILDPMRLLIMLAGVVLGLFLGVIPGLGGIVGLALLIPFTYHLDGYSAFALLLGMAAVTTVSDFVPAVLFGVPGTVGAAATVLDGHPLAKKGEAARAFGAGYISSLTGGIFGAFLLALTIPILRPIVLYLGSAELLSFCIFGLSMVAVLSGRAPLKGLTAATMGLMLAMIGSDPETGTQRWTFDQLYLWDRLPLVPVTLGFFALPELADMAISRKSIAGSQATLGGASTQWDGVRDGFRHWWLILRCSGLGAILGAVPGIGSAVIDWIAYAHAVQTEKNPERFGHGDIRGVIAAESSNNAKEGGHLVPTIAFGVPAGASMALLLSAFFMHGFTPGPEMLTKHLDVTYSIIWTLTIAHLMAAVICLFASNLFAQLALIRVGLLVPAVIAIVYLGAINTSQSWGDLISVAVFGLLGWVMKQLGWPRPPLILGLVLGAMFERYFFISNELYGAAILTRPIVVVVLLAAAWVIVVPILRMGKRALSRGDTAALAITKPRLSANGLFTLAVLGVVLTAIALSQAWPPHARLVPLAAAYAALVFAGLTFVTDTFFRAAASNDTAHDLAGTMDRPALDMSNGEAAPSVLAWRAVRFFAWIAGSLAAMAAIGLLPGLFFTILLMARIEFGGRTLSALTLSAGMTILLWVVFDRIFGITWPMSLLGDAVPWLRTATGLL